MLLMDEGRKRIVGIMVAIFAARRLAQWDGRKRAGHLIPWEIFAAGAVYKSGTCFPQNSFIFKKLSLI
jgi:hypothetical protein